MRFEQHFSRHYYKSNTHGHINVETERRPIGEQQIPSVPFRFWSRHQPEEPIKIRTIRQRSFKSCLSAFSQTSDERRGLLLCRIKITFWCSWLMLQLRWFVDWLDWLKGVRASRAQVDGVVSTNTWRLMVTTTWRWRCETRASDMRRLCRLMDTLILAYVFKATTHAGIWCPRRWWWCIKSVGVPMVGSPECV